MEVKLTPTSNQLKCCSIYYPSTRAASVRLTLQSEQGRRAGFILIAVRAVNTTDDAVCKQMFH